MRLHSEFFTEHYTLCVDDAKTLTWLSLFLHRSVKDVIKDAVRAHHERVIGAAQAFRSCPAALSISGVIRPKLSGRGL